MSIHFYTSVHTSHMLKKNCKKTCIPLREGELCVVSILTTLPIILQSIATHGRRSVVEMHPCSVQSGELPYSTRTKPHILHTVSVNTHTQMWLIVCHWCRDGVCVCVFTHIVVEVKHGAVLFFVNYHNSVVHGFDFRI